MGMWKITYSNWVAPLLGDLFRIPSSLPDAAHRLPNLHPSTVVRAPRAAADSLWPIDETNLDILS